MNISWLQALSRQSIRLLHYTASKHYFRAQHLDWPASELRLCLRSAGQGTDVLPILRAPILPPRVRHHKLGTQAGATTTGTQAVETPGGHLPGMDAPPTAPPLPSLRLQTAASANDWTSLQRSRLVLVADTLPALDL